MFCCKRLSCDGWTGVGDGWWRWCFTDFWIGNRRWTRCFKGFWIGCHRLFNDFWRIFVLIQKSKPLLDGAKNVKMRLLPSYLSHLDTNNIINDNYCEIKTQHKFKQLFIKSIENLKHKWIMLILIRTFMIVTLTLQQPGWTSLVTKPKKMKNTIENPTKSNSIKFRTKIDVLDVLVLLAIWNFVSAAKTLSNWCWDSFLFQLYKAQPVSTV